MDYEFLRDITGVVKVRMSMGHEVVGHWFNEEVKENLALLDEVEQAAHALKGSERSWQRAPITNQLPCTMVVESFIQMAEIFITLRKYSLISF